MLNQDMVNAARKLLDSPVDGSRINQQAREIARTRLQAYTAMLVNFASKNPGTSLAHNLTEQAHNVTRQYHL